MPKAGQVCLPVKYTAISGFFHLYMVYSIQRAGFTESAGVLFILTKSRMHCKGDFIRALSRREDGFNYLAMERCADVAVIAMEKYALDRGLGRPYPHGGWEAPDGAVYKDTPWDIPLVMRGNVRFMPMEAGGLTDYFDGSPIRIF